MNSIITDAYSLFELYQALRNQLMEILTDEDLSFRPGGDNPSLGELCRQIGEIEQSYINSFKTFEQDFSYRNQEPGLQNSIGQLTIWFEALDKELKKVIEGLTEEMIQNQTIDRGGGFNVSPRMQLEIYKEALLIFYGKTIVYLKTMEKPLPKQWQDWID
jgi:uncharacterized damage-inducible protein DinB